MTHTSSAQETTTVTTPSGPQRLRVATFNVAMGLEQGELAQRLARRDDPGLQKVAAIIQRVRPDLILLNEFDDADGDHGIESKPNSRAHLFREHYLTQGQFGEQAIDFPYSFSAEVNTGQASGVDLDGDGRSDGPGDAYGFGLFPGQYSMLVLSRLPILKEQARSWQYLRWRDYPGAKLPQREDGSPWYGPVAQDVLRLSSKSHWDVPVQTSNGVLHFMVAHPTPPVFDGPEDRNGLRNHDEIGLLATLIDPQRSRAIRDDTGVAGGLPENAWFIVAGDLNADPLDGDSAPGAVDQLLNHPLINSRFIPISAGAARAAQIQGGKNLQRRGNPAAATADFNDDKGPGNLRIDFVLPSTQLTVLDGGVFWPSDVEPGVEWIDVSDHRLVWLDVILPDYRLSK